MFQLVAVCLLVAAASCAQTPHVKAPPIEPPLRYELPPPPEDALAQSRSSPRSVVTSWITMPVDHFDPQNSQTFQMRYMYNEEFFGGDGSPVFILVGGEWDIVEGWLRVGNMYQMAQENHGYMIYTEHRYYGRTLPFTNFNVETLRYLNVDQALADLAYFIRDLRKQPRFAQSEVVLYGGSYAANMAMWFKKRYPHLVKGAVASSGPIKAKADFFEYLEVVHEAFLSEGGQECVDIIKEGIEATAAAMDTEEGRRMLEREYRLCDRLDYENPYALGYFSGFISWAFSGEVQTARPGTLRQICNNFRSEVYGFTPLQKVAGYIVAYRNIQSCINLDYQGYLDFYIYSPTNNMKAWYYQTCTEYGYYQNAPSSGTAFDSLRWLNLDFYVDFCKQVYDPSMTVEFVKNAVDRVNLVWGGLEPDVNNTINIHGVIDPWHALGVHDRHIKESSPTITVPRASHCFDMQSWLATDTILMSQAQATARRIVRSWLNNHTT